MPGAFKQFRAGKLLEPLGIGADDHECSIDGRNIEFSIGSDHVSLSESRLLPHTRSGFRVHTVEMSDGAGPARRKLHAAGVDRGPF